MLFNIFKSPEIFRAYMPLILEHVLFLIAVSFLAYKFAKLVPWRVAFRRVIANVKSLVFWLVVLFATIALPTVVFPIVVTATNALALILIVGWVAAQFRDPGTYLGGHIAQIINTKPNWREVFFFWKEVLSNPGRALAMAVIIATESGILEMIISIIILIGASYGVNHFFQLSQINWEEVKVQKIASAIAVAIAIMKFLLRIGMPGWLVTVIVIVVAVLVGLKAGKDI